MADKQATTQFRITDEITIGGNNPFVLIAGPCVIESEKLIMETAEKLKQIAAKLGIPLVFKSSFDKANRTSLSSFGAKAWPRASGFWPKSNRSWAFRS